MTQPRLSAGWIAACTLVLCSTTHSAENTSSVQRGVRVEPEAHHDTSIALRQMPPAARAQGHRVHAVLPLPRHGGGGVGAADLVLQSSMVQPLAPAIALNFDGIGNGFSGPSGTFSVAAAPPDTNGSVGPNHYVQIVNTDFVLFNKSGSVLYGPVPVNTLWSGFGGGCQTNNDGDPVVLYDKIADRWVISQFSVSTTPYLECVAVSTSGDPTGSYNRYSFSYGNTDFPDYPKMSVWPDAYYTTFNIFAGGTTFSGGEACAYDRTSMLAGHAATQQCFNVGPTYGGLLPSDLDGPRQPPAGAANYVVSLGAVDGQLAFWKFHVDFVAPSNTSLTGPTTLTTSAFTLPCNDTGGTCVPQSGLAQQLDTLGDRLMFRLAYRNFSDHESLIVNHSVTAGSSVGVRWYELRPDASRNLTIYQQGTYAPDSDYRWMGSMAMDQAGNMALGFSLSGTTLHPEIHFTGRLAGDALGMMTQGEGTIINGAGSQGGSTGLSRWGDYSAMALDPSDDCTFWYTNEYIPANGEFNWKTRIASFKLPGCPASAGNDFSISASPTSLSLVQGTSGSSTIATAVTGGSAGTVSLAVSGVPSGASASFNPGSVTAGNSSMLNVSTGTAAPGTYTLTVKGTEGSATHSTTVKLTVTAKPDFTISASPGTLSLAQGTSGSSSISTTVVGSAGTVGLAVSGAPSGATTSVTPASINAGGRATLNMNAGTAAPGTYTLTVKGTEGSATHSTTVRLTVTAKPDFTISASPGTLSLAQGTSREWQ